MKALERHINNVSILIDMSKDLRIFKALGEETKHSLLVALLEGETCACELPRKARINQPNCSMQLSKLLEWGLVKSRREGRKILYSIKDKRVPKILSISKTGGKKQ
jgi:DNA-binding transcriptional ArsR family regulator